MNTRLKQLVSELDPVLLEKGNSGDAVATLQEALCCLSIYEGEPDGYFGPELANSIQQLQQSLGLAQTGCFDNPTWYALTFWAEHEYAAETKKQAQGAQSVRSNAVASQALTSMIRRTAQLFGG